ncbi:MAG: 3-methyl-2-oxobutanoate dehydrogenase subunit VorB [Clostridia bacterium]|jgi:2-oxoglutarate ferredoxin oxidoreductase subunit alpha|nr:3-methyl-2-oxobutanoate dehydrogenase subunit VorB [Clostridia bacterium]
MGDKVFMQGNEAFAEAAIRSGCKFFFGYPITPSSEIPEYYAKKAPSEGLTFIQAETEVSAFNMVAGVAATGKRGMTATSGPGFSLGCEAMSYMSAAGLPSVIVDCMRPGPADGEILGSQGDYNQLTKGGGHGDYNTIVLAPYSVQEYADFAPLAFDLAEKYRNPVVVASDGTIAKMMENVEFPEKIAPKGRSDWACDGMNGRDHYNDITTCGDGPEQWEKYNLNLQSKYTKIRENEQRWEEIQTDDADILIVAFGSLSRVCLTAMRIARENGIKVGIIRPITLWPFPVKAFEKFADKDVKYFVTELNAGQMVNDVKLAVNDNKKVEFYGRLGGITPTPVELYKKLCELYK